MLSITSLVCVLFLIGKTVNGQRLSCPTRTSTVQSSEKLQKLRVEMTKIAPGRQAVIEAYVVTSHDDHQSEYTAERDKRLKFLSGYTGRVGQAAITRTKAAIWVEAYEFWKADEELDCDWDIYRLASDQSPQLTEWLKKELRTGVRVGADPKLIPAALWEEWKKDLESNHIALVEMANNLIDEIWTNRPTYASTQAFFIDGGESRERKLDQLRSNLSQLEVGAMIVTALDEIAWLLNVRGNEGPFIPFVRSYLIVTRKDAYWYLPREQKTDEIFRELEKTNISRIRTQIYDNIWKDVRITGPNWGNILVPSRCEFSAGASQAIASAIAPSRRVMRQSPVIFLKARKNEKEIHGMREANLRDSAAIVDFIAHLEEEVKNGTTTEESIAEQLLKSQREQFNYFGAATPVKVAFGPNSALRNYNAGNVSVDDSTTLVIRTAGHYLDGTTSIARTLLFGTPSMTQVQVYTRTLASLVEFARQTFPVGVRTAELDVVARLPLWKQGVDYSHRTGHGIGAFSTYRESPVNINRNSLTRHVVEKGGFLTAAPSQSKPGLFGVELENVFQVVGNNSGFFGFEPITLVPFEVDLIEPRDMTVQQVHYINEYHADVLQTVGAELKRQKKMKGFYWLMKKTQTITPYCSRAENLVSTFFATTIFVVCFLW